MSDCEYGCGETIKCSGACVKERNQSTPEEIGNEWLKNLEHWFPKAAEEMKRKEAKNAELEQRLAALEAGRHEDVSRPFMYVLENNGEVLDWAMTKENLDPVEEVEDSVIALYTTPQPAPVQAVPEGLRLVPIVPTAAMINAAACVEHDSTPTGGSSHTFRMNMAEKEYAAMLSAAPTHTATTAPDSVLHLVRFLANTWSAVDKFVYEHCVAEIGKYPVIQGTKNQRDIARIGAQPFDRSLVAAGVAHLLAAPSSQEREMPG